MRADPVRTPGQSRLRSSRDATSRSDAVSTLLRAWAGGDEEARDKLMPLVYEELRRRAAAYLRRERADHTLQPTALVHETYMRLAGQDRVGWQSRAHFFAIAAQMMRRILVDHARGHHRRKRGGDAARVTLDASLVAVAPSGGDVLALDEALTELAAIDPQQGRIVELRYFGGLTESETAGVLGVSRSTITREWQTARAWLHRRIKTGHTRAPA